MTIGASLVWCVSRNSTITSIDLRLTSASAAAE
jgi:hypothetical protein